MPTKTFLIVILSVILIWSFYHRLFSPPTITYKAFHALNCVENSDCVNPTSIPMVIYRSWKTKDLEDDYQSAWDFTAYNNPGYKQILFDDNEMDQFMETVYSGKINNAYKKIIPNTARADLFRYCLLYEKGGVWLDMKSAAKSLCKLIRKDDTFIVSTWHKNPIHYLCGAGPWYDFGELQQWWMVSSPKHPILKACIDMVVNNIETRIADGMLEKKRSINILGFNVMWNSAPDVIATTGPIAFTKAILNNESSDYRLVCPSGNGILIYDYSGKHKGGLSYGAKGLFFRK